MMQETDKLQPSGFESSREDEVFVDTLPLLLEDEKCDQEEYHTRLNAKSILSLGRRTTITIILSSITTVFIILSLRILWNQTHTVHTPKPFVYDTVLGRDRPGVISCGNTVEEAISRGCKFDELADLWLPERCSRTYAGQYTRSNEGGPFKYWADKEGRHEISNRSLYVGEEIYWSTTRDHLVHCVFNMFRFAHSLRYGSVVGHDGTFSSHVEHCASLLGQYAVLAPDIDNIDVETQSGFGYC